MILPLELQAIPDDTAVVGDIDAFIRELEEGKHWLGWQYAIAFMQRQIDSQCPREGIPTIFRREQ